MKMQTIKKHIMTGISFLIPMVVMAGIVGLCRRPSAGPALPCLIL